MLYIVCNMDLHILSLPSSKVAAFTDMAQLKYFSQIFFISIFLLLFLLLLSSLTFKARASKFQPQNTSVSAILVFGDSTVDPGNNNHLGITFFKSNFPPYGRDFPGQKATGRFTNGRLVTDYITSYVGLKESFPAYLDPTLTTGDLMTGVSFASAGSGLDPLTAKASGVFTIPQQLDYFREYKAKLEVAIGKERTKDVITRAVFIISAGTNDLVAGSSPMSPRRKSFTVSGYHRFLLQNLQNFIQAVAEEGAQKIAIVSLPPVGCLPIVITTSPDDVLHGRCCKESLSSEARDYNRMVQNIVNQMINGGSPKLFYTDIYAPLIAAINDRKLGFEVVNRGCCATGLTETAYFCNEKTYSCPDASKYVFWDSIHPTDRAYYNIFASLIPLIDVVVNL